MTKSLDFPVNITPGSTGRGSTGRCEFAFNLYALSTNICFISLASSSKRTKKKKKKTKLRLKWGWKKVPSNYYVDVPMLDDHDKVEKNKNGPMYTREYGKLTCYHSAHKEAWKRHLISTQAGMITQAGKATEEAKKAKKRKKKKSRNSNKN